MSESAGFFLGVGEEGDLWFERLGCEDLGGDEPHLACADDGHRIPFIGDMIGSGVGGWGGFGFVGHFCIRTLLLGCVVLGGSVGW